MIGFRFLIDAESAASLTGLVNWSSGLVLIYHRPETRVNWSVVALIRAGDHQTS